MTPIEAPPALAPASEAPLETTPTVDSPRRWLVPSALCLLVATVGWTLAYLIAAVPGPWLTNIPAQRYSGAQMKLTHGSGFWDGTHLAIRATDANGLVVVTVDTPTVRATDYHRIRWKISAVDPDVTLATLWRTLADPGKIYSAPLAPYGTDVMMAEPLAPDWSGAIEGVALTIMGTLRQPIFIEELSIEASGMRSTLADRFHDWFDFRNWTGLSINAAIGGPLEQPVWLTVAVVLIAATAIVLFLGWRRTTLSGAELSLAVAAIVTSAWITLDARWLWSRVQQAEATSAAFAGKSLREKHVSDIDGYVFAFAEQVILRLPKSPSRVFVGADDHYFGGRLAYHLYPHNVYMNHDTGALPPVDRCKPGDYVVVFRHKGVRYDPANKMLSWDQQPAVPADVLIAHQGNAAFRLR